MCETRPVAAASLGPSKRPPRAGCVLGGGIGANGDLLLTPIRERLAAALPFAPKVEVSTLGDAAVLTGALAIGMTSALENAFADRA